MKSNTSAAAAIAAVGLCFFLFSGPAQAALLTWKLQDATFVDPNAHVTLTGTGAFSYDAATHSIVSWDITVAGDATSGVDFHFAPGTTVCGGAPCTASASRSAGSDPGTDLFEFLLASVPDQSASLSLLTPTLTDSGGTKPLLNGVGPEFFCCGVTQISADVATGSVSAVPETGSATWLALGLVGLMSIRRLMK
jgi:hypothetical protein